MRVRVVKTEQDGGSIIWSLTMGREYEVIGIEADWYRIVDDRADPILFDPACFDVVDPSLPSFWRCDVGDEGERYCYPVEWNKPGFFEAYHDGVAEVRERFWGDYRCLYHCDARRTSG